MARSKLTGVWAEQERIRRAPQRRRRALLGCAGLVVLVLVIVLGRALLAPPDTEYWLSHAQDCGAFGVYAGEVQRGYPQAAMICFMQAHAQCRAATLTESFFDASTLTYLVEPLSSKNGPPCAIQMNDVMGGAGDYGSPNQVWIPCAQVAQRWYGLHFSGCGRFGDLVVSVTPLSQGPAGKPCGDIQVHYTLTPGSTHAGLPRLVDNSAPVVIDCFLQAQQTCQEAWAASTTTYPDQTPQPASAPLLLAQDRLMLLVEPHDGTCSVLELEWHTGATTSEYIPPRVCASVVLQDDGLHGDQCGPTREPVLPACSEPLPPLLYGTCKSVPPAGT